MTQQELDDLFRANSERGEFAPEPGEWEIMTALLDEDERKDRHARWVSIAWMSLFVLLILGGTYGLWAVQQGESDQPTLSTIKEPIANLQEGESSKALAQSHLKFAEEKSTFEKERADNSLEELSNSLLVQTNKNTASSSSNSSKDPLLASAALTIPSQSSSSLSEISESLGGAQVEATTERENRTTAAASTSRKKIAKLLTITSGQRNIENKNETISVSPTALVASDEIFDQDLLLLDRLPLNKLDRLPLSVSQLSSKLPNVSLPASTWSRFGLGFFVAEELNSVAMSNKMRLGTRVGVQLRYNLKPKWSVDLGVSYAHKSYMAPKGEMQNTLGLFFDDVLPAQTDGQCDILEIPLTLTYLPKEHGNAGPFISGGLISYQIFREDMVFHYDEPTTQATEASAPNKGALFGTAKLQAGYQFVPNKGPAWRVGPYLHVPITMVGSGKLPIYSAGLQLGLELF